MPESRESLTPIRELMDKALDSPSGLRLTLANEGMARNLLYRLRTARLFDQKDCTKVYGPGAAASPYFSLGFERKGCVIFIRKGTGGELAIDEIEEL